MRFWTGVAAAFGAAISVGACSALSGLGKYDDGPGPVDATQDHQIDPTRDSRPSEVGTDVPVDSLDGGDAGDTWEIDEADGPGESEAGSCAPGLVSCDGICVPQSSPSTCGGCAPCGDESPMCALVAGSYQCVAVCPSSSPTACNGTCVDPTSDPVNCGGCGAACSTSLANARPVCVSQTCTFACNDGYNLCGGICVAYSTATNCGGCGNTCPVDAGVCTQSGEKYGCVSGCASPSKLCGNSCVDVTSDGKNCASCGNACTTNVANAQAVCVKSMCTITCDAGYTLCGGACVPLTTSSHCGSCSNVCMGDSGTPVCAGTATNYSCVSGCPSIAPLLCTQNCVDATQDVDNCGSCGNTCTTMIPNAQAVCVNKACAAKCNGNLSLCASSCVDTTSDNANCGSCSHTCTTNYVCSNSSCVSTCATGTTNCGNSCVNEQTDTANCNGCGETCTTNVANASPACSGGACTFACNSGFTLCNGACVNEQTDLNNCGGCGSSHVCASGQSCTNGSCVGCTMSSCTNQCVPGQSPCCRTDGTCGCWYDKFTACM